ncbi:Hypothetical protein A7982_08201 [Minicystis rosea]|nr:Hypothetical protein A7982_08201 [Minicystis rosea]
MRVISSWSRLVFIESAPNVIDVRHGHTMPRKANMVVSIDELG